MTSGKIMNFERGGYLISTEPKLLDPDFICRGLNGTYWARNRPREVILESIRNSVCFGVYEKESKKQVGFARIVTDEVTFSWLCDVFIDEEHRKKGLGKWLISCVAAHPSVIDSTSVLGTRDAHGLYARHGFERSEMMRRAPSRVPGQLPEPIPPSRPVSTER